MLDEMSIRKHVQYDGKKVPGYVHLGTVIEIHDFPASNCDSSPLAWLPQHLSKMISIVSVDVCVGMHTCGELSNHFLRYKWVISQFDGCLSFLSIKII